MALLGKIVAEIELAGLAARGAFALDDEERRGRLAGARTLVLVGMVGTRQWPAFAASPEAGDGAAHPLDRWSRGLIDALAQKLDALALFPFDGPPYWPFQQWAKRAERVAVSPLGMLIHPDYGLWHSYRGALGFADPIAVPPLAPRPSPCDACEGRPCLKACPVGAFAADGYDVAACAGHLRQDQGRPCMDGGCLARRACPIGASYAHGPAQARFHMRAFLRARGEPS